MKSNKSEQLGQDKSGKLSTQKPAQVDGKKEINPVNQPVKKDKGNMAAEETEELDEKSTDETQVKDENKASKQNQKKNHL